MAGIDCVVHLAGQSTEGRLGEGAAAQHRGLLQRFRGRAPPARQAHRFRQLQSRRGLSPARALHRRQSGAAAGHPLRRVEGVRRGARAAVCRQARLERRLPAHRQFRTRPADDARQLLTWISHRDMVQLVRRCIDHPDYHFIVVYGVSNNLRSRWDNSNVKFPGYLPEDDAKIYAAEIPRAGRGRKTKFRRSSTAVLQADGIRRRCGGDRVIERYDEASLTKKREKQEKRERNGLARGLHQLWRRRFFALRAAFVREVHGLLGRNAVATCRRHRAVGEVVQDFLVAL